MMVRTFLILGLVVFVGGHDALEQLCNADDLSSKCICGYDVLKYTKRHYVVDCAHTDLENVPDSTQLPPFFTALDVSFNKIKDLTFNNEDFESKTLKILNARYNEITEISAEFMSNVPSLNQLDVSHNKITILDNDLFEGTPSLHHLDLSYNDIKALPDNLFKPLKGLKLLDISYNFKLGVQIEKYDNLLDSPLKLHPNLTTFNANYINLTYIPRRYFENLTLTSISLADNNLFETPILPGTVKHLDLSGNHFKQIDAHHMNYINLKTLRLNRLYNLSKIKKYAFYNLQSLESLSLENCPYLKEFDKLVFGVLVDDETWTMKEISLAGNSLRSLDESYFKMFSKLERVDLDENPWICDCNILWFSMLKKSVLHKNLRCASPQKYRNKNVLTLLEKEIPQCARGTAWRTHKMLVVIISILVVTLMAIIMYLIYLGPFRRHNNQSNPVGALSPYNSLVVRDDEP